MLNKLNHIIIYVVLTASVIFSTEVDIAVTYSNEYANSFHSAIEMESEIHNRIAETNLIYSQSGLDVQLVLLYFGLLDLRDEIEDLDELRDIDRAYDIRDSVGADLLSFWTLNGVTSSGSNYSGNSSSAFSTLLKDKSQNSFTLAHEIGHNLGAKHDRQTYIDQGREDELTQELYRYGITGNGYRTVMAYDNCTSLTCDRIPYFSNPDASYRGEALGIAVGDVDPANNVRRINEVAPTVSNFKTRITDPLQFELPIDYNQGTYQLESFTNMEANEVEESELGYMYFGSGDLELGNDTHLGDKVNEQGNQKVGLRFTDLFIPNDATIDSAFIQFTASGTKTSSANLKIEMENNSDCLPLFPLDSNLSQRSFLSESVQWIPDEWSLVGERSLAQRTPDLSDLVQNVVNKNDWASNHLCFAISAVSGKRTAVSSNGDFDQAPSLTVYFSIEDNIIPQLAKVKTETPLLQNRYLTLTSDVIKFQIFNLQGKLILERQQHSQTTDIFLNKSDFPTGLYYYNIISLNSNRTSGIINIYD